MSNVQFRNFVWPENPEEMELRSQTNPIYVSQPNGTVQFMGMGEICRIVELKGVFHGSQAYVQALQLRKLMDDGIHGTLSWPQMGSFQMYMTRLQLHEEGRAGCIAYSASFRERNASGQVPPLSWNPGTAIR